jgi:nitrite reductase/ring-hydroxylating ferredoxin subunit
VNVCYSINFVLLALGVLINNHLRCFAHGACFRVDTGDIEDHPGHGHLPSMFYFAFFLISIDD